MTHLQIVAIRRNRRARTASHALLSDTDPSRARDLAGAEPLKQPVQAPVVVRCRTTTRPLRAALLRLRGPARAMLEVSHAGVT